VAVAVGTRVAPGQVLVELDQALFQAALRSAEARLSAAERAFERAQRLATEGIIPRKDVETAQTDLAVARTELVTARRASELSILRSPIAGVVTRLNAALGAPVDVSQVLVEVADPSALDVLLGVTSNEARRVRPGADVTLAAGQRANGEPLGIGKVADVAATVDTLTRSVNVRVSIPSARRPLRIGETVYGQIALETRPDAIVVPEEAIVPEGEGFKVFVVDDQSIAHQRPVTVGARADSLVEILEGLKAGERVVTYGAYGVVDSAKVVPLGGAPKPGAAPGADTATKQDVGKGAAKPAAKAGDVAPGEKKK
jgi:membrane fusion protein (multidrug efflux system)